MRNLDVPGSWQRALVLPLIVLAWLVVNVVALWLLSHLTHTIILVVLATVVAFALTPLANFISGWTPRPVAIGLAYLLGAAVIFGLGAYVIATTVAQVTALISDIPQYANATQSLQPRLEALLAPLGISPASIGDLEQQLVGETQAAATAMARDLIPRLAELFGTVVDVVLILMLSIYLAADSARIANWLTTEMPGDRARARAQTLVAVVNRVVGGYIRGMVTLALLIGVLVGAGMAVLGVPYAVLLGVLAFFMEFVPVLGVFISGAAAVAISVVHFGEPVRPALVLAYFVVLHVIEGDVVGPRTMGRAVGIHPATGLVALVLGNEAFGIWGALYAAPVAGLLQAVVFAAWLEQRWVIATISCARTRGSMLPRRVPASIAIAAPLTASIGTAFVLVGSHMLSNLELHQLLSHRAHAFAQEVDVFLELGLAQQLQKRHPQLLGHRLVRSFRDLDKADGNRRWPAASTACVKSPHVRGLYFTAEGSS